MNHYKTVFNNTQDFALNYQIPLTIHDFHNMIMLLLVPIIIIWPFQSASFSTLLSALESSPVGATCPGSLILSFLLETSDGRLGWRREVRRRVRLKHLLLWLPLWEIALVWLHHWTEGHCSSQAPCFFITLSFHIQRPLLSLLLPLQTSEFWACQLRDPCTSLHPSTSL